MAGAVKECSNKDKPKEKDKEKKEYKLYYSFYFDGTLNNKHNTKEFQEALKVYGKSKSKKTSAKDKKAAKSAALKTMKKGDSYLNDYSNVAKIWRLQTLKQPSAYEETKKAYIEGIGTTSKGEDSFWGYALGTGATGIEKKCEKALKGLIKRVKYISQKGDCKSIVLKVDAFGFSRGSAAARHFINLVDKEDMADYKVSEKKIRFVGLFDTVSSHGGFHDDDTEELYLKNLSIAEKVYQYSAADEHRLNFALTSIKSAGGKGKNYSLPGVHSDIGGGYNNNIDEGTLYVYRGAVKRLDQVKRDAQIDEKNLIDMGYFKENEFKEMNRWNEVFVTRGVRISNEYSKVALHLLVEDANDFNKKDTFEFSTAKYVIKDAKIKGVFKVIKALKAKGEIVKGTWHSNVYDFNTITLKELRRKYCHFSAVYGGFKDPHEPNLVKNKRKREEYEG